ncbi:MAG: hypothetical protein IPK81_17375 [Rhodospirillales bacterium]|nr:MAG: hypothetical protein IPK81_17375 [Rhodospirillales bacterium]
MTGLSRRYGISLGAAICGLFHFAGGTLILTGLFLSLGTVASPAIAQSASELPSLDPRISRLDATYWRWHLVLAVFPLNMLLREPRRTDRRSGTHTAL